MGTVYNQIIEEQALEKMRDPATATAILDTLAKMNKGEWPKREIANVISRSQGSYTITDAMAWIEFCGHWLCGAILEVGIDTGRGPKRDSDRQGNQRILDTLPKPFVAKFTGQQTRSADGYLEWTKPIRMYRHILMADGTMRNEQAMVRPGLVPLEAGTLSGYVVLQDLEGDSTGVARWPYGSDFITLMIGTKASPLAPFPMSLPRWRDDPEEVGHEDSSQPLLNLEDARPAR